MGKKSETANKQIDMTYMDMSKQAYRDNAKRNYAIQTNSKTVEG